MRAGLCKIVDMDFREHPLPLCVVQVHILGDAQGC
jgi:hypothetical protein